MVFFRNDIRHQFDSEMADVLVTREMDNLAQTDSIKDHNAEHSKMRIWAPPKLDVDSLCRLQIFMRNFKSYLYKLMNMVRCRTWRTNTQSLVTLRTKTAPAISRGGLTRKGRALALAISRTTGMEKKSNKGEDKNQKDVPNTKL